MTSFYFEELIERYGSEIDDLRTDSEGKDVLKKRVREKRGEFPFLLTMIDAAPEMVAPVFHGAFRFGNEKTLVATSHSEPGDEGFASWDEIAPSLEIQPWAQSLIETCLQTDGGDSFLVSTVVLEWLLGKGLPSHHAAPSAKDEDEDEDLSEAGESWMSEQGFDSLER